MTGGAGQVTLRYGAFGTQGGSYDPGQLCRRLAGAVIRYVALLVMSLALFPAVRWAPLPFVCLVIAGLAIALSWAARDRAARDEDPSG